jgi:hypothetical protein
MIDDDVTNTVEPFNPVDLRSAPDLRAKLTAGKQTNRVRTQQRSWFIRGPIPGPWIAKAASLSLGAVRLSLALWHTAGVTKSHTVRLSAAALKRFSIPRIDPALWDLEQAGLITVARQRGRRPTITILEVTQ